MPQPFIYPRKTHSRRHKPPVFSEHGRYKEYLRDEFVFRCVYCLVREKWKGSHWSFAVEHFRPKSRFPDDRVRYRNLLYACEHCNHFKGETVIEDLLHPEDSPLGEHLDVERDGTINGTTNQGRRLERILNLNAPDKRSERGRKDYRRMMMDLWEECQSDPSCPRRSFFRH
jgi:hypothetical protein